jgi:hypothetical protein
LVLLFVSGFLLERVKVSCGRWRGVAMPGWWHDTYACLYSIDVVWNCMCLFMWWYAFYRIVVLASLVVHVTIYQGGKGVCVTRHFILIWIGMSSSRLWPWQVIA